MGFAGYPQLITPSAITDGPALTAGTAASCIPTGQAFSLPIAYWKLGRIWNLKMSGRISSVITTPGTARFDLRIGGVVAFDSQPILLDSVAAHTNVGWKLLVELTCRTANSGTGTQLFPQGLWTCEDILGVPATAPKGVLAAVLPWNVAPALGTGFDNTIANTVDVFFTQTAATGSLTVHDYFLEELT